MHTLSPFLAFNGPFPTTYSVQTVRLLSLRACKIIAMLAFNGPFSYMGIPNPTEVTLLKLPHVN
jgi:hypothetical protein